MTLVLTLLELVLAVGLIVLVMARERTEDPARRERLGSIASRVTVPTIMAIAVLGVVIMLDGV